MATLFTPGHPTADWYEYRHDVASYAPLVTGAKAPFNDSSADMARYYHSLGLYFPCTIGDKRVLLFKSGLHLDYDGPQYPVRKLMAEIAQAVEPKVFITTGTGGGIGADVKLGDVVDRGDGQVRLPASIQERALGESELSRHRPLPAGALAAMTPALMGVNSARIPGARADPPDLFISGRRGRDDRRLRLRRLRRTTTVCRVSAGPATWATRWSATPCNRSSPYPGTRSGTPRTRRFRTRITTSKRRAGNRLSSTPSTAA